MNKEWTYPVAKRVYVTEAMARQLADYRFSRRIDSEVEAMRELLAIGLETALERKEQEPATMIEHAIRILNDAKEAVEDSKRSARAAADDSTSAIRKTAKDLAALEGSLPGKTGLVAPRKGAIKDDLAQEQAGPDIASLAYKMIESQLPMTRSQVVPEPAETIRAKAFAPTPVPLEAGASADAYYRERIKNLRALEPYIGGLQFNAGEIEIPDDVMKAALQRHIDEANERLTAQVEPSGKGAKKAARRG